MSKSLEGAHIGTWDYYDLAGKLSTRRKDGSFFEHSREECATFLREGDRELLECAERIFDTVLETELPKTAGGMGERSAAPVGGYARVGAALRGHPNAMWRREESPSKGLVRVYFELGCPYWTGHETMLQRGLAITALAYAWQMTRPVELIGVKTARNDAFSTRHEPPLIMRIPLGKSPLNLSRVAAIAGRVSIIRRLYDAAASEHLGIDYNPNSKLDGYSGPKLYASEVIQVLTEAGLFDVDDVYIGRPNNELATPEAALAWVHENQHTMISD